MGGSKTGSIIQGALSGGVAAPMAKAAVDKEESKKESARIEEETMSTKRESDAAFASEKSAKELAQAQESATIRSVAAANAAGATSAGKGKFGASDDEDKLKTRQTVLGRG